MSIFILFVIAGAIFEEDFSLWISSNWTKIYEWAKVLSTLNSKLVDETINSCSNILNSSVSETVNCGSNLSTPQISEEYNQRKNVKKKLDEQLLDVRKQLHENFSSLKSNNELLHYHNKTPPTTLTPWAKGTTLI